MFDENSSTFAQTNNNELSADLGQVQYLFCDKNGTMTENKMKFSMCSVKGRIFGKSEELGYPC